MSPRVKRQGEAMVKERGGALKGVALSKERGEELFIASQGAKLGFPPEGRSFCRPQEGGALGVWREGRENEDCSRKGGQWRIAWRRRRSLRTIGCSVHAACLPAFSCSCLCPGPASPSLVPARVSLSPYPIACLSLLPMDLLPPRPPTELRPHLVLVPHPCLCLNPVCSA